MTPRRGFSRSFTHRRSFARLPGSLTAVVTLPSYRVGRRFVAENQHIEPRYVLTRKPSWPGGAFCALPGGLSFLHVA